MISQDYTEVLARVTFLIFNVGDLHVQSLTSGTLSDNVRPSERKLF
jgi:hypothetical protein